MSVLIYDPPKRIDEADEYYWPCSPRNGKGESDSAEGDLIRNRAKVMIYAEIADDNADYSFDDFALVRLGRKWYLLNTTGCSCPSPAEEWNVQIGPSSLAEIRKYLVDGDYSGYTMQRRQLNEFLQAIDAAGDR